MAGLTRDEIIENMLIEIWETGSQDCPTCTHYVWGPGGDEPQNCTVLNGDCDPSECPALPEDMTEH